MKIINHIVLSSCLILPFSLSAEEVCTGGLVPAADNQSCVTPEAPDGYTLDNSSWDIKFVDDSVGNAYGCNYYGYGSFILRDNYTPEQTMYQQHVSCGGPEPENLPLESGNYSVEYAVEWPTEVNTAQQLDNTRTSMFSSLGSTHDFDSMQSMQLRDDSEMKTPEPVISCDSTGGFECPEYKIIWTTVSVTNTDTDQVIYRAKQAAVLYFYDPTLPVSDVQIVSYDFVSYRYYRPTRAWEYTYKVTIGNVGDASASNISAVINDTNLEEGHEIFDATVSWTDPDNVLDIDESQQSGDVDATFTYRYSVNSTWDVSSLKWDITLTDNRGTDRVIRNVSQ